MHRDAAFFIWDAKDESRTKFASIEGLNKQRVTLSSRGSKGNRTGGFNLAYA